MSTSQRSIKCNHTIDLLAICQGRIIAGTVKIYRMRHIQSNLDISKLMGIFIRHTVTIIIFIVLPEEAS